VLPFAHMTYDQKPKNVQTKFFENFKMKTEKINLSAAGWLAKFLLQVQCTTVKRTDIWPGQH
jgi:hypothetical protein